MKNKLKSAKRGSKTAAKSQAGTAESQVGQDITARYWSGEVFDEKKYFDETFTLASYVPEHLDRDLNGNLFIKTYLDGRFDLRQISFAEACAWLVANGQRRAPEKFLAFYGIQSPGSVEISIRNGEQVASVPIDPDAWALVLASIQDFNEKMPPEYRLSVASFIHRAVTREAVRARTDSPFWSLENCVEESVALMQLLSTRLIELGKDSDFPLHSYVATGAFHICDNTCDRLVKFFKESHAWALGMHSKAILPVPEVPARESGV